ncbi:MAG TPA: PA14 domain-containing protein [Fimbriimonadaceae bacterium]|nr:PA14 domain-containing protein [Fimbriimonadaceae bacterium]
MAKICVSCLLAGIAVSALAQAPAPPGLKAESSGAFSYYLVPSDVIGFKDCPQGFQVTYDGAFNNGYGELDLEAGATPKPFVQRVKTLFGGNNPILEYDVHRDGVIYSVESFGAPANLDPREDLVAFIRVRMTNSGRSNVRASLRATFNKRGGFGRAELPCRPWYQAKFMDAEAFKKGSPGEEVNGGIARDGHLLYLFSGRPQVDAAHCATTYAFDLAPGKSQTVYLKVPFVPIRLSMADTVRGMDIGHYRPAVLTFWNTALLGAMSADLNDPKVTDAMRTNLIYDLIARDIEADGEHFTQTVNKFQYHYFYMRDTSFIAHTYDLMNLHRVARETVEHYLIRDAAGKVTKLRRESPDDWGQSLWAVGAHFRATGDLAFARDVHPAIGPHLDEFMAETSKDPLGLWPVAGPYDNELINGHYTSHNLWALLGLREAENLCRAVGDTANADRAHRYYVAFYKTFMNRLAMLTAKDEGYIPPGMDDPEAGHDWENASGGVYPFGVFPPDHPWVTATVNMEREYKYREGIMTWGPNAWKGKLAARRGVEFDPLFLHDYDTFQVSETLLARGEQEKVVEDLYSTLVHTSSTHAGFETSIRPWGNRDPDGNYPPHGWFAARYNELVHNMLVRDDGETLHLASALAPQWIAPGKTMWVSHAACSFGTVGYRLTSSANRAVVTISANWRKAPAQMLFHVPFAVRALSATVDGRAVPIKDGVITMPPRAKRLVLNWRWIGSPGLTYDHAVRLWLHKNYEPKPGEDTDHLFPTLTRPGLASSNTLFTGSYDLRLVSRSGGMGTIHYTLDGKAPTPRSPRYSHPIRIAKTTFVRAIEVTPDGKVSEPLYAKVTKATLQPAITGLNAQPGLEYSYYEGEIDKMPNFGVLTPTRQGTTMTGNLDDISHRPEKFALRIEGYIVAPKDGIYTFWTGSDDGSVLWIGGTKVVDNDGPHAYKEEKGQVALKAGIHPIRIEYYDSGGANYLRLFWQGPGFARRGFRAGDVAH